MWACSLATQLFVLLVLLLDLAVTVPTGDLMHVQYCSPGDPDIVSFLKLPFCCWHSSTLLPCVLRFWVILIHLPLQAVSKWISKPLQLHALFYLTDCDVQELSCYLMWLWCLKSGINKKKKSHATYKQIRAAVWANTYCTDEGQVEDWAKDRYSSNKANYNWEETPDRKSTRLNSSHIL